MLDILMDTIYIICATIHARLTVWRSIRSKGGGFDIAYEYSFVKRLMDDAPIVIAFSHGSAKNRVYRIGMATRRKPGLQLRIVLTLFTLGGSVKLNNQI